MYKTQTEINKNISDTSVSNTGLSNTGFNNTSVSNTGLNNTSVTNTGVSQENKSKLRIAVMGENGIFAFSHCKPNFGGMAVDIWELAAKKYNLDFEYSCLDGTFDEAIQSLGNNEYDAILGDFSVIDRRLPYVNFTRPFTISKLYIFKENRMGTLLRVIMNRVIFGFLIFLTILILSYTFLYQHYNKKPFLYSLYQVILNLFSDVPGVISSKIKNVNKNNIYIIGLETLWIFLRYVFFAIVIAQLIQIITKLRVAHITNDELKSIQGVNVKRGSSHVDYINILGKTPILNDSREEIFDKMRNSDQAVYGFEDYYPLMLFSKEKNMDFVLTENPMFNDESAIIVNKKNDDLLQKLNSVIIELRGNGTMKNICEKNLGNPDYCII